MKLHLTQNTSQNLFTACGEGYVAVNGRRFEASLIVLPDQLIESWEPRQFEALSEENFVELVAIKPEIVLLGTGLTLRFPHPRLTRALLENRIGVEVMDSYAAARTYNILMAEGRQVAAALIL